MKAFSYNRNAPLRMRTPQEGSAPQDGVAATRKVGLRPSKIEGMRGVEVGLPTLFFSGENLYGGDGKMRV